MGHCQNETDDAGIDCDSFSSPRPGAKTMIRGVAKFLQFANGGLDAAEFATPLRRF
jgi:hypothetical protein